MFRKEAIIRAHGFSKEHFQDLYPTMDTHYHTGASGDTTYKKADPKLGYEKAIREGLDVVGPTDHNTDRGYRKLVDEGYLNLEKRGSGEMPVLLGGWEATTNPNKDHVILRYHPDVDDQVLSFFGGGEKRRQMKSILEFVHDFPPHVMIAILAHPLKHPKRVSMVFEDVREAAKRFSRKMLGINLPRQQMMVEVLNGYQVGFETRGTGEGRTLTRSGKYDYRLMVDRVKLAESLGLPMSGGSDAHETRSIGKVKTIFETISMGKISATDALDMMSRGKVLPYSERLRELVKSGAVDLSKENWS